MTIAAGTDNERERVVRYWRAIELFSPQSLPRIDARGHVEDVRPGEPVPWEAGSHLSRVPLAEGKVWRHQVFGGAYDVQRVVDTLVEKFGDEGPADQRESVRGQSALFGCTVDAEGLLVDESAVLSSCAWAVGRACTGERRSSDWLTGFDQDVLHFSGGLARLAGKDLGNGVHLLAASMREAVPGPADSAPQPPARLETHPLTGEDIQRFVKQLAERLGVTQALDPRNVRVRSYQLSAARASEMPDSAFLNSFLEGDLRRVARALRRGDAGPGLISYLSSRDDLPTSHRVDVRRQPGAVRSGCQPEQIPLGRWPADTDHSLILSQQFAVNQVMEQLTGPGGLGAINGPPGTGKTTMLRDLIAAVVVQRALRLAELASPHDAFSGTKSYTWATSTMRHKVVPPRAELTGFEIAVASANNGAVENVSTEIPGPGGIGPQWRERATHLDYFTGTADLACGEGAWALVAARLGNRSNRSEFVQRFWWGDTGQDRRDGMRDVLKTLQSQQVNWAAEVATFTEAAEVVRRLAADRQTAATAIERLSTADADRARAMQAFRRAEETYRQLEQQLHKDDMSMADVETAQARAETRYAQHQQDKPGLLVSLSTRFRAGRDWHTEHLALREAHRNATERLEKACQSADQLRGQLDDTRAAGERARDAVTGIDRQAALWRREADQAVASWGNHVRAQDAGPRS